MNLKGFFKASPSILLAFDKVTPVSSPVNSKEVLDQVDEVKKYYRFEKLSNFIDNRKSGTALLVFENARKGVFLHVLPVLVAEKIPFTLFLRPECIGTNRLPLDEEALIYKSVYGESQLTRGVCSPFPFHQTDPLDYFVTWGKIRDLPPTSLDFGINLQGRKLSEGELREDLQFVQTQMRRMVRSAICENGEGSEQIASFGIEAIVTGREGVIEPSTSLYDLPRYPLEKKH